MHHLFSGASVLSLRVCSKNLPTGGTILHFLTNYQLPITNLYLISNPLASSCIHLSVLELCVKSVLCGLIIPMQPELISLTGELLYY